MLTAKTLADSLFPGETWYFCTILVAARMQKRISGWRLPVGSPRLREWRRATAHIHRGSVTDNAFLVLTPLPFWRLALEREPFLYTIFGRIGEIGGCGLQGRLLHSLPQSIRVTHLSNDKARSSALEQNICTAGPLGTRGEWLVDLISWGALTNAW